MTKTTCFNFLKPQRAVCNFLVLRNVVISTICKMSSQPLKFLNLDNINPNIVKMNYPVRGPITYRAAQMDKEMKSGVKKPFKEVIRPDFGDCHAMGQLPITFIRQVLSAVLYPPLLDSPDYPEDVKEKAKDILGGCLGGSIGSYTHDNGMANIRKHVADYFSRRDGVPCNWEDVVLFAGVGDGIRKILRLFVNEVNGKKAGVMLPVPQYPLYSVTLEEFGLHRIDYYLDESRNWGIDIEEMKRSINEARNVCNPKVLVIINPGNPTGQVFTRKNTEEIIRFAYEENLYILADEVYQDNIYADDSKFYSFRKVLVEMGQPYSKMEITSFMSCSKGFIGECGLRAGFGEIRNMCPNVKYMFSKVNTATLCPPSTGQACIVPVVRPPEKGDPSYELYVKETEEILSSLKLRAKFIVEALNSLEGVTCNEVQGAMYAFPQIRLPPRAVRAAKEKNLTPDEFYCMEALEKAGICLIPGEGFGQVPGTYHFRTTTLLPIDKMEIMVERLKLFHKEFMDHYRYLNGVINL